MFSIYVWVVISDHAHWLFIKLLKKLEISLAYRLLKSTIAQSFGTEGGYCDI